MPDDAERPKPIYAGKVAIRHAIETVRACGIDVAGFELRPDGTIFVFDGRAKPEPESLYDQWKAGRL